MQRTPCPPNPAPPPDPCPSPKTNPHTPHTTPHTTPSPGVVAADVSRRVGLQRLVALFDALDHREGLAAGPLAHLPRGGVVGAPEGGLGGPPELPGQRAVAEGARYVERAAAVLRAACCGHVVRAGIGPAEEVVLPAVGDPAGSRHIGRSGQMRGWVN